MKREEITSVIDHTAHENEAIAHLGNTVQSILLMIIQETLKNVMGGGGGSEFFNMGFWAEMKLRAPLRMTGCFFWGGGGGVNLYDQIVYWGHELKHEYKLGFLS